MYCRKVSKTNTTYLADAATIQLEFITLSYYTGNPIFAEKVNLKIHMYKKLLKKKENLEN